MEHSGAPLLKTIYISWNYWKTLECYWIGYDNIRNFIVLRVHTSKILWRAQHTETVSQGLNVDGVSDFCYRYTHDNSQDIARVQPPLQTSLI